MASAMGARKAPCGRMVQKPKPVSRSQIKERWAHFLEKSVLKNSQIREQIFQVILEGEDHFTAVELLGRVKKKFPEIGKATLYRNLPVFLAAGILEEGPGGQEGVANYELASLDHHDHLICMDCQAVIEFHQSEIEKLQSKMLSDLNFQAESHRHVLYVRCQLKRRG